MSTTNTTAAANLDKALEPMMEGLMDLISTVGRNCAERGMTTEQTRAAILAHLAQR